MTRLLSLLMVPALACVAIAKPPEPNIVALVKQLQSPDLAKAVAAAASLGDLGPQAAEAVPDLVKIFRVKNEDLRLNAAIALGKIGKAAVKPLADQLKDKDDDVRFYSVWALAWVGPDAKEASSKVIQALGDVNDGVRRKAAYALGRINPEPAEAVKALIKTFGDKNPEVRQAAGEALAKLGTAAAPGLIAALQDDLLEVRSQAMKSLGDLGAEAKEAVSTLKTIFLNEKDKLHELAGQTLGKIGKDAITALSDGLKSDNSQVAFNALKHLAQIGAQAVPAIVDALGHKNNSIREQAAVQLGNLQVTDKVVVIALAHALNDEVTNVRLNSLNALQRLGAGAGLAFPKILAALADADVHVRQAAGNALVTVRGDPDKALAALKEAYKNGNETTRTIVTRAAGTYGAKAVPFLIEALKDAQYDVRLAAITHLAVLPVDLKGAVADIAPLVKDENQFIRRQAVIALGRAGEAAVPHLLEALQGPEPKKSLDLQIRIAALNALRTLGPAGKKAIPQLAEFAAKGGNITFRRQAISALGAMGADAVEPLMGILKQEANAGMKIYLIQSLANLGPDAKAAIPTLESLTKDANVTVRTQAQIALNRIRVEKK